MVPRRPGGPLVHPGPLLVRRLRAVRGTVVSGSPAARRSTSGGRTTPCMRLTTVARCSPAPARGPNWSCAPASGSLWPACRDGNGYPGPRRGTGPPAGVRRPAGAVGRGGGRWPPDYTVAYWRSWLCRSRYQGSIPSTDVSADETPGARVPIDMRGVWVTGRVGWCHTELGVLGGYRRRVAAIGCCRAGTAGIVVGPPVAGPGQDCQTARTAGASAVAWARPALAAAARRDTSSTLRPMARTAARSGRTSTTRAPAAVSAAA